MVNLDHFSRVISVEKEKRIVQVQAGIRLYDLHKRLAEHGLAMPNLGSISDQSVAGFMSTGTHGSSMRHTILSEAVIGFKIVLADGSEKNCSMEQNERLYKAALVSLGALGIIVEITLSVVPGFKIKSTREIVSFTEMLHLWRADQLWDAAEFVRVWWFPYNEKAVIWKGESVPVTVPSIEPPGSWYRTTFWTHHVQQALLYAGRFLPSAGPLIERTIFRNTHDALCPAEAVQPSNEALNMDCLFSQYTNEWSVPLANGPEACRRLGLWLAGKEAEAQIPYSSKGIYTHAPIELRVTASSENDAWLSTTTQGPVCYIGVIMYKPYHSAISYRRYFQAYEHLMRSLGGRPHWAKQHNMCLAELKDLYPNLSKWLALRQEVDPNNMFTTDYHRRHLLDDNNSIDIGVFAGKAGRKYKARL